MYQHANTWRVIICTLFIALFFSSHTFANNELKKIVEQHQKIIYLLSDTTSRDDVLERDRFIARNFYYQKRELLESYELIIIDEDSRNKNSSVITSRFANRTEAINTFLSFIDSDDLRAADQLAFIDLVDAILFAHNEKPFLTVTQVNKIRALENDLEKIQNAYGKKIQELTGLLGTRGKTIETWETYIHFLQARYSREDIRRKFNTKTSDLKAPATRGKGDKSKQTDPNLVWGFGIPEKTVVLTFDDGPHYRHTDTILDTLKEHNAHAYFFAVGKNFGSHGHNGDLTLKKNAQKLERALAEGHKLGNHSFSHRVLTKLESDEQKQEVNYTNTLLTLVSGKSNTVFRPPYGSKDAELQTLTTNLGMRSIMWNIDSEDWADPLPESIVERVMTRLKKNKRGIVLFHDIHKQTVKALPNLLTQLAKEGYTVVDIDGNPFTKPTATTSIASIAKKVPTAKKSRYYNESWAVVIGINTYTEWPQLNYAVNDARAIEEKLKEQFGFKEDHIFSLYDKDATRDNITDLFANTMADSRTIKPDDRVFIFYAGHGMTRKLPSGRDLGYIIPVDASFDKFHSRSISMTHLRDFSEMIPAKHVYYVMDSCYSGIALTRGGGGSAAQSSYLNEITSRTARQILTAGGADQEVADGGLNGHSIFTWNLLQGMSGLADLDKNNIITASELGAYVSPIVANNSNQTPAFGNLLGSEGGEFIFELNVQEEDVSATLETDVIPIEKYTKLEMEIQQLTEKNNALQLLVASLQSQTSNPMPINRSQLSSGKYNHITPKERKIKSLQHHKDGLEQYKNKQYDTALINLKTAVELNPTDPSIVNNYGFVLFKAGQYEESLIWLEKTIELEPKRTVVYLNIADTLMKLQRETDALKYYEHYLYLFPSSPEADNIHRKIEKINRKT